MVKHEKALRRPFRWVRAFGLAACVMLCAPLSAWAQSPDESALRALLERFFSAYRAKDLEGVMALWSKGSSDSEAGKDALGRDFVAQEKQGLKNLSVGRLTVEGKGLRRDLLRRLNARGQG